MTQPAILIAASLVIAIVLGVALWVILFRLSQRVKKQTAGSERHGRNCAQLEDLESKDISFLVKHPTVARTVIRELRYERRKVLRKYLCSLRHDFDRTCAEIKAAVVAASGDRPDLTEALFRQQVRFKLGLLRAEWSM